MAVLVLHILLSAIVVPSVAGGTFYHLCLSDAITAGNAGLAADGALTGVARLRPGSYQALNSTAVSVFGRLVVVGRGTTSQESHGVGALKTNPINSAADGTTLDLSLFEGRTAFTLLSGASLELHNLTIRLQRLAAGAHAGPYATTLDRVAARVAIAVDDADALYASGGGGGSGGYPDGDDSHLRISPRESHPPLLLINTVLVVPPLEFSQLVQQLHLKQADPRRRLRAAQRAEGKTQQGRRQLRLAVVQQRPVVRSAGCLPGSDRVGEAALGDDAVVAWHSDDTIFFRSLLQCSWRGVDVTITKDPQPDRRSDDDSDSGHRRVAPVALAGQGAADQQQPQQLPAPSPPLPPQRGNPIIILAAAAYADPSNSLWVVALAVIVPVAVVASVVAAAAWVVVSGPTCWPCRWRRSDSTPREGEDNAREKGQSAGTDNAATDGNGGGGGGAGPHNPPTALSGCSGGAIQQATCSSEGPRRKSPAGGTTAAAAGRGGGGGGACFTAAATSHMDLLAQQQVTPMRKATAAVAGLALSGSGGGNRSDALQQQPQQPQQPQQQPQQPQPQQPQQLEAGSNSARREPSGIIAICIDDGAHVGPVYERQRSAVPPGEAASGSGTRLGQQPDRQLSSGEQLTRAHISTSGIARSQDSGSKGSKQDSASWFRNRDVGGVSVLGFGAVGSGSALDMSLKSYFTQREAGLLRGAFGSPVPAAGHRALQLSKASKCRDAVVRQNKDSFLERVIGRAKQAVDITFKEDAVQLIREIGSGSFGCVYFGLWRSSPVAVKVLVIDDELYCSAGRRRHRAILEAAIGATLDHPNVAATYAYDWVMLGVERSSSSGRHPAPSLAGEEGTRNVMGASVVYKLYIVQEFCSGGSLKEALGSGPGAGNGLLGGGVLVGGPMMASTALFIALDIACGLRHVHAAGIVHGDVSSGNILLARPNDAAAATAAEARPETPAVAASCSTAQDTEDRTTSATQLGITEEGAGLDESERAWSGRLAGAYRPPIVAKVADFGLSMWMNGSRTHASGLYQGTPLYVAPEVYGMGRVSRASDVYSYGVLLLEVLQGRTVSSIWQAHAGRPMGAEAMVGHGGGSSPLLAALRSSLPEGVCPDELKQLVASCLAVVPADRPSFDTIVSTLVDVIEGLSRTQDRNQLAGGEAVLAAPGDLP